MPMQKRRKQKGRRHRRVNRTPRPVARSRAVEGSGRAESAGGTNSAGPAQTTGPVQSGEPPQGTGTEAAAVDETIVFRPVQAGGIGRPAERTWQHLRTCGDAGASVDELSGVVGYQSATINRHVDGLAAHHLAQQRDGRWYAARAAAR
ncbi:helix-turn-helix domain-containing protein [Streptomyces sp. A5-4]|uniref:helix-turn-helix domain-containing protein n=1 Tax=Streptomyces sp. A5-4 TaxID=3384771 RepID=UPI003DA835A2